MSKKSASASKTSKTGNSQPNKKRRGFRLGLGLSTPWGGGEIGYDAARGLYAGTDTMLAPLAISRGGHSPGMGDVNNLQLAYDIGSIYYGNGTNGVNGAMYITYAGNVTTSVYNSIIAIAPGDNGAPASGAVYINDLYKHFARVRYKSVRLRVCPDLPSTSYDASIYLAPVTGGYETISSMTVVAATPPTPFSVTTVQSMKGNIGGALWSAPVLDMTKYIRGGTGPKQNEFDMTQTTTGQANVSLGVPCEFTMAGVATSAALLGVQFAGRIRCEITVDLIDFVGNFSNTVTLTEPCPHCATGKTRRFHLAMLRESPQFWCQACQYPKTDSKESEREYVHVLPSSSVASGVDCLVKPSLVRQTNFTASVAGSRLRTNSPVCSDHEVALALQRELLSEEKKQRS